MTIYTDNRRVDVPGVRVPHAVMVHQVQLMLTNPMLSKEEREKKAFEMFTSHIPEFGDFAGKMDKALRDVNINPDAPGTGGGNVAVAAGMDDATFRDINVHLGQVIAVPLGHFVANASGGKDFVHALPAGPYTQTDVLRIDAAEIQGPWGIEPTEWGMSLSRVAGDMDPQSLGKQVSIIENLNAGAKYPPGVAGLYVNVWIVAIGKEGNAGSSFRLRPFFPH